MMLPVRYASGQSTCENLAMSAKTSSGHAHAGLGTSAKCHERPLAPQQTACYFVRANGHPTFAERVLRNIGSGLPRQSGLMLAARITLPHFSVSSATSFPNSAGVIGMG